MRPLFTIIVAMLVYSSGALCQVHQVYQKTQGFISDEGVGKQLTNLEALPPRIRKIIHQINANRIPARFVDKLTFECGQSIDVQAYLAKEKDQATRRWVVPAYDLQFSFHDSSIGVGRYVVDLQLDQDGQVLEMNLPNEDARYDSFESPVSKKFSMRTSPMTFSFVPLDSAIVTSIDTARSLQKKTDSVLTDLRYDRCGDNLHWLVSFPQTSTQDFTVEIDVQTGEIAKTYYVVTLMLN